jgi:crotonobetaine/carnitine-CoA ligase
VVRQLADGTLVFVDRKKNIIRRAGENIAAAEVEAALQAHPAVAQVAVLAVADELREEEVMACVVPLPGHAGDLALAEALAAWCAERLAYYKAPGWIWFTDVLPTTGTQKIQKHAIFPSVADPRTVAGMIDLREHKRRVGTDVSAR